jgi:hypothetical protein
MRLFRPRLRAPAQLVVLGAVAAVIFGLAHHGWGPAVGIMVPFLALAAVYYAGGGQDTDMGAIIGSRPDERQASVQMKVLALQGKVMAGAAGPIFMIAVLGKAAWWPKLDVWPFAIPLLVASVSGLAGWVIYRERGNGDDEARTHAGRAGPRIEPRFPARRL